MAHQLERLIPASPVGRAGLAAATLVAVLILWLGLRPSAEGANRLVEQSAIIERRPFTASITFTGTIVPGDGIAVTAPFEGTIKALGFSYGDRVAPGQVLAEIDLSELEQRRNEAETAFLKASQTAEELDNWQSGAEVSRARRTASSAALDLKDTERKIEETAALLDRGLVPRSEYDALIQQRRVQQMAAVSAADDLRTAVQRGDGANRRVAALDLANARARLAKLNSQFAGAAVRAPEAGIIVRPPTNAPYAEQKTLNAGSQVVRGQMIGLIARAGGLGASFSLDEGDVGAVKVGQQVTVTGPGFPGLALTGQVVSIAGEASATATDGSGKASFTAIARLAALTPDQAQQVRIGMSANIAITTYTNASAIVVPPQAVRGAAPEASVLVRSNGANAARPVIVQIGQVGPDGVEILGGLKPGDRIVWKEPAPPQSQ